MYYSVKSPLTFIDSSKLLKSFEIKKAIHLHDKSKYMNHTDTLRLHLWKPECYQMSERI